MSHIGILFDLDGTLIDSLIDIATVANQVRESFGLAPMPVPDIRRAIGKGADHLMRQVVPEKPESEVPHLVTRYKELFLKHFPPKRGLYPGVRETLEILQTRGVKMGVVTNKTSAVADKTLAYFLPEIRFEVIAGPERVTNRKPNPSHILEVLPQLGVPQERVWYVGDDPVDAECAQAAGVRFLGATYGIGGVQVGPEESLSTFAELLSKLPQA